MSKCCNCGYDGDDETPCRSRTDETHCVHWWDGSDEIIETTTHTDEDN